MNEIAWLTLALVCAWCARRLRLPVLVGYLAAGVILGLAGEQPTPALDSLGHAGVLLLLFGVGLHLRLRNLFDRAVLFGAGLQLMLSTALFVVVAAAFGMPLAQALFIGVILSFSSTVLAATDLEARRLLGAYHGRVAIGILLIQDLVAVGLIFAVSGKPISPIGFLVLPAAVLLRPVMHRVLDQLQDDALILGMAVVLPLGGGLLFEHAGYSAEFGAILLGALLADHRNSDRLQKMLWSVKELLLIGFFIKVGMIAIPTDGDVLSLGLVALCLLLILPFKSLIFFGLLVTFGLRARTAFLTGAALTSYSEFCLMAGVVGLGSGLIDSDIFAMLAMVTMLSFVINSPLNGLVNRLYLRYEKQLQRFERDVDHPDKPLRSLGRATHVIVGMGRTGVAAYDSVHQLGGRPLGIDSDPVVVERQLAQGRRCVFADAFDPQLWEGVKLDDLHGAIISVPDLGTRLQVAKTLRKRSPSLVIASYAIRATDTPRLRAAGVDDVHHILTDAGIRLAEVVMMRLAESPTEDDDSSP